MEKPTEFFILKAVVPSDTVELVLPELARRAEKVESQVYNPLWENWTITLYCGAYGIVISLVKFHREGLIEEFRII